MPSTRNTTNAGATEISPGAWGISAAAFEGTPLFSAAHARRVLEQMIMEQGSVPVPQLVTDESVPVPTPPPPQPRFIRIVPVSQSEDTRAHFRVEVLRGQTIEDYYTETTEDRAVSLASRLRDEYAPNVRNTRSEVQISGNRIARAMRPSLGRMDRRSIRPSEDVVSEDGLNIPDLQDDPLQEEEQALIDEAVREIEEEMFFD